MVFVEKMFKMLDMLANLQVIRSIRNGLVLMIPIIIIGAFAVIIINLPIDGFKNVLTYFLGTKWIEIGNLFIKGTNNIFSLFVLLSVSYSLAQNKSSIQDHPLNPVIASAISLVCLVILIEPIANGTGLPFIWTSATGLFVSIFTAVTSTLLYIKLSRCEFLDFQKFHQDIDSNMSKIITTIMPAFFTILPFVLLKVFFSSMGFSDIHRIVYDGVTNIFVNMENDLSTALLFNFFTHLFWFFGLHGTNILEPVALELYNTALQINSNNMAMGAPPTEIITKPFFDAFVFLGGCGSSLCLVIAILVTVKKGSLRKIAKISLPLALFNINEIIIYGLPVVFNPYYLVPFFLVPFVLTVTTYLSMHFGLVPLTTVKSIWTTPMIVSGYITTGSINGIFLQLFNLVLGTLIYIPFVRTVENRRQLNNQNILKDFYSNIAKLEENTLPMLLSRSDSIGNIAKNLASDMKTDLKDNVFTMEYQPQFNSSGKICSVEALLRWPHREHGLIPPPITLAIAEEADLIDELGDMIIHQVFKQVGIWQQDPEMKGIITAINISAMQVKSDRFIQVLQDSLQQNAIKSSCIELELTEGRILNNSKETWQRLENFRKMGFRFAIDDFGMGHNSMRYLREFPIDTLKIDGSLVKDVVTNQIARDIIASIVQLANTLNLNVIAEFVESKEQVEILEQLGCHIYQGYYCSASLPAEQFMDFVKRIIVKVYLSKAKVG